MMAPDQLFSIEKVTVVPRKGAASGCNVCQHCFLLRRAFLEKQCNEALLNPCTHNPLIKLAGRERVKE